MRQRSGRGARSTPPAVSQHLRVLRDSDLVVAERRGYHVHYRANEEILAAWKGLADELLSAKSGQPVLQGNDESVR